MQHEDQALEPHGIDGSIRAAIPVLDDFQNASGTKAAQGFGLLVLPARLCKDRRSCFELPTQCNGFRDGGSSIAPYYTNIGIRPAVDGGLDRAAGKTVRSM
ncbi:MAG TPA: hypothetical protein VGF05_07705 [Bryobacteraceae bacterium]